MLSGDFVTGDSYQKEFATKSECEQEAKRMILENLDIIKQAFPDYKEIGFYCDSSEDKKHEHIY